MSPLDRLSSVITEQFERQMTFLQKLVQINSSHAFTPDTSSPDVPVELEVAQVIVEELQQLGFEVALHGMTAQRPNVVRSLRGLNTATNTLILTTHMDRVESGNYTRNPWGAHMEQGRLYGVGAADAKAQIAIFVYALHALRKAHIPLAGNVTLALVVDEEG